MCQRRTSISTDTCRNSKRGSKGSTRNWRNRRIGAQSRRASVSSHEFLQRRCAIEFRGAKPLMRVLYAALNRQEIRPERRRIVSCVPLNLSCRSIPDRETTAREETAGRRQRRGQKPACGRSGRCRRGHRLFRTPRVCDLSVEVLAAISPLADFDIGNGDLGCCGCDNVGLL